MRKDNDTDVCQICGKLVPVFLRFKHNLDECQPLPDANNPLLIKQTNSVLIDNREQQEQKLSQIQQNKIKLAQKRQELQQRQQNNQPQQNQQFQQRSSVENITESQIMRLIVVCDFCQEEYSKDTYEEHLTVCEQKKIIEGIQNDLYIEDDLNEENQQQRPQRQRGQRQPQPNRQRNRRNRSQNESPDEVQDIFEPFRQNGIFQPPQVIPRPRIPVINNLLAQGFENIVFETRNGRQVIRQANRQQDDSFERFINIMRRNDPLANVELGHVLQRLQRPNQRVTQDRINEQITIEFKKSQGLSEEHTKCSICMADYEENEKLILLECTHRYHKQCIEEWMKRSYFCPVCKFDIRGRDNQQEEEDEEFDDID
ncbi:hypothetical protein pb186bvf_011290 [Paramecium bursaria]